MRILMRETMTNKGTDRPKPVWFVDEKQWSYQKKRPSNLIESTHSQAQPCQGWLLEFNAKHYQEYFLTSHVIWRGGIYRRGVRKRTRKAKEDTACMWHLQAEEKYVKPSLIGWKHGWSAAPVRCTYWEQFCDDLGDGYAFFQAMGGKCQATDVQIALHAPMNAHMLKPPRYPQHPPFLELSDWHYILLETWATQGVRPTQFCSTSVLVIDC